MSFFSSIPETHLRRLIYLAAVTVSMLLSLWLIQQKEIINQDAVFYINAIFNDTESVQRLNNWLFYSKLIYWLSLATGLELETSAHLLNTLLDALLVIAFLRMTEELGAKPPVLIWAALIILSLPYFNDNRSEIIRGHGYWAFALLAATHYIRLYRRFNWAQLATWLVLMAVATLFRIEGMALILILPTGLLLNRKVVFEQRLKNLARSYLPIGIGVILITATFVYTGGFENRLLEVGNAFNQLYSSLAHTVPEKAALLRQHLFPLFSDSNAQFSIYTIVISAIAMDLIQAMTFLYFAIWVARKYFPASGLSNDATPIITVWFVANIAVLIPYMLHHFVMVSRYTLLLAILLLVVVAFSLAEFREKKIKQPSRVNRLIYGVLFALIAIFYLDSLIESRSNKVYIAEAGHWLRDNLDRCARVGTDHQRERLRYYANTTGEGLGCLKIIDLRSQAGRSQPVDWMMLEIDSNEPVRANLIKNGDIQKAKEFLNERGDGYALYRIE